MKLFNLDLHISVIEDVKGILNSLYGSKVEVTNWSISGHNWVFGKPTPPVEVVNQTTWHNISLSMIQAFQDRYDTMLASYDGFIVTHTPVFCLLYEKYGKPVILVNSCRYEQPFCWTGDMGMWSHLNMRLQAMSNKGQLIAVSNNRADQAYLHAGAGISSVHIPSLCLYTGASYNPRHREMVLFGDRNRLPAHPLLIEKPKGHTWRSLYEYRAIVHLPYEVSTMSIFEQITAGVPLFFPSKRFLKELMASGTIQLISMYSRIVPESLRGFYESHDKWIELADFYNIPFVYFFDSFEDLFHQVEVFEESEEVRAAKRVWLFERRLEVLDAWKRFFHKYLL